MTSQHMHGHTCTSDVTAMLFGNEDDLGKDDGVWMLRFRLLASLAHRRVHLSRSKVLWTFLYFVWMLWNMSSALKSHIINTRYINVPITTTWWRSSKGTTVKQHNITGHDKPEVAEYGGPHEAMVDVLQRVRRHLIVCRKRTLVHVRVLYICCEYVRSILCSAWFCLSR